LAVVPHEPVAGRAGRSRRGVLPDAGHRDVMSNRVERRRFLRRGAEEKSDRSLRGREIPCVALFKVELSRERGLFYIRQQRDHPTESLLGRCSRSKTTRREQTSAARVRLTG